MSKIRFKIEKLIPDLAPESFERQGMKAQYRVLEQPEYRKALLKKLDEEALEVAQAQTTQELTEEIADVLHVLKAIAKEHGITWQAVQEAQEIKQQQKGGYAKRLYGEHIEMTADHPRVAHFRKTPKKYPEF